MSLVISLTCALLATLLQQWARRYLKITQSRYSPHKRARIRAFFAEGVEKCLLPWTVGTLPTLLHLSLFLFFAGLVVFLCNVNLTIFKLVLSWVGLCAALYGFLTCMPIIRHDSPYYTPLSFPAWHIVTGIPFLFYRFLRWLKLLNQRNYIAYHRYLDLENSYRKSLAQGMQKTAEETALNMSSEIDTRAFLWTFDCLDEDDELERFFSGLPGFRSSKVVKDPLPHLTEEEILKLYGGLRGLLERTFSSDLLPTPVRNRRALICAKAVDPEHTPVETPFLEPTPTAFRILDMILSKYRHSGAVATGIVNILRGWGSGIDEDKIVYARMTICKVLATSQPRGNSWYNFASDELGFPETSLREYAAQGDSLSLVILLHIIRQQCSYFRKMSWLRKEGFSFVLAEASKLEVENTSSELQHEFCTLWNQIVREAQGSDWQIVFYILRPIRNVFLALHQDTDSAPTQFSISTGDWDHILRVPSSYPLCKVSDHSSESTPRIHDGGVSAILARAIPHDPNDTAFIPSITSLDRPPSPTHAPLPVDGILTDALLLDNQTSVQDSTQPIGHSTTEVRHIFSAVSLSPVMEPSRSTQLSTSSPSPNSNASASLPADTAIGNTALSRAPSDDLTVWPSPSPLPSSTLILDPILPTGLLAFNFNAVTRSDLAFSSSGSHSSTLATDMRTEADASHSTLRVREESTATADIPSQLSLLSPVTGIAIDGFSTRSFGTEHIEHRPPGAIVVDRPEVRHTPLSDVEVPSSPTLGLPIGML